MGQFTESETSTLRNAAMGALALISQADPGFIDTFKEAFAGSKSLAKAPAEIAELFKSFQLPQVPTGTVADFERSILDGLAAATSLLGTKSAEAVTAYRDVVVAACDAVANAADGVTEKELAMIAKIKQALGVA